ncbi:MAG: tyrosine-type recombinase/integrase [Pseudomonadota bacterium]
MKQCGIAKKVSAHTFRQSVVNTHLLQTGIDIRTIQWLLGHDGSYDWKPR